MSWKLGRVSGIDLYLHSTFLLLLAYVGLTQGGAAAVLLVSAVFGCVLLHELGHALAAQYCGIRTRDITLYPIGGVARLERMPRKPASELLITLAGPAVNVAIAAVLAGLLFLAGSSESWAEPSFGASFLTSLMWINVMLAGFNMIPAFPMDGGRVLRASLSGWLGRLRATEVAAGLGQLLAIAFGVWSFVQLDLIRVALAVFIYVAARNELARTRFEEQSGIGPKPSSDGIWTAPPGYRWVYHGAGLWRLAPVWVTNDERASHSWR